MGTVYEARHVHLGRRVAVKILHPLLARERSHVARFRREAEAVSRLEHPNVVQVLDVSDEGDAGPAYCVMERLDGVTWSRAIRRPGGMDPELTVRLGRQLLSALDAAHGAGVVHRDIKPGNVMIVPAYDGREMVKLVDFGIAHLMETTGYTRLTQTGHIVGTPTYMAPEQALGDPVDARTDVYAAGAVLFTALAGRPPFERAPYAELLPRLLAGDRPRLTALRPNLDPQLAACIERAMSPDPARRFASAAEMEAALGAWATGDRGVPTAATAPLRAAPAPELPDTRVGSERMVAARPMPSGPSRKERRWGVLALAIGLPIVLVSAAAALVFSIVRSSSHTEPATIPFEPTLAPVAVPSATEAEDGQGSRSGAKETDAGVVARESAPRRTERRATRETRRRTVPRDEEEAAVAAEGPRSGPLAVTVQEVLPREPVYDASELREPVAVRVARTNRCLAGLSDVPVGGPWRTSLNVTIFPNGETRAVGWSPGTLPLNPGVERCVEHEFGGPGWPLTPGDRFHSRVAILVTLQRVR